MFKHIPLMAHLYGFMPLAEFTKVVGVPGSGRDGDGDGDGDIGGVDGDCDSSLQPAKMKAVANRRLRENSERLFLL